MLNKILVMGVSSSLLAGCFAVNTAQSPMGTTFEASEQQKMQSAHHWDVLANHQAELLAGNSDLAGAFLYVDSGNDTSTFGKTYSKQLTSALIKNGLLVSKTPGGAAVVEYDVSVVEHSDREPNRMPVGFWTALTAGVWVASEITSPVVGALGAAAAADAFSGNNLYADTDYEVVITTQVSMNNQISLSTSSVYYVNGGDTGNYKSVKNVKLTASK